MHNDFFEEIAKLRAARRIWAREMRETFGAKNPRRWLMRFHTQTAGVSLTAQQPEVNLVRVAIQALAAVLGGAQSLHTNSMDEALALPSEHAVTLALRTQQVIAHESGVANTIDPLGGSFFVEKLTNDLEEEAYAYFRRIDDFGGVLPALEAGFFQQEIADSSFRFQQEVDAGERTIVGVNAYQNDEPLRSRSWKWTRRATSGRSRGWTICAARAIRTPCSRALDGLRDGGARHGQSDAVPPRRGARLCHAAARSRTCCATSSGCIRKSR